MSIQPYFSQRATVRQFTAQVPSDTLLLDLLQAAMHAPTTGNMQLYSVIFTHSEENREALNAAHFNQPAATDAPVLVTFCADCNRMTRWCELSGADPCFDNFQSFVAAWLDTALLAQQFVTVAEQAGLGTCYLGTTTYNAPQIAEALALPRLVVPVCTLAVGFPKEKPAPTPRLACEALVHTSSRYNDYSDNTIRAIYAPMEADPQNQAFVAENNKQNLAQVFSEVRYPRANAELFSKIYSDFITSQGF